MNNLYLNIFGFIACTAIIIFSGSRLANYGDQIAELKGWGKAWVGLILLSSVTTLPELVSGISAVAFVDEPDLAVGNAIGSCMFNLMVLSLIDMRIRKPLTSLIKTSHLFTGLLSIILIGTAGIAILTGSITPVIGWISPFSIILIIVYIAAIAGIFRFENSGTKSQSDATIQTADTKAQIKKVFSAYIMHALIVVGAAMFLPFFGEQIAEQTGLGNTLFGTFFLAASTSLPELVVSITAIRLMSFDLTVGNLLGSNIFNMLILAIDDIFYTKGSLFGKAQVTHLETIIAVIIMTSVIGLGLLAKSNRKFWRFGFDTFIIVVLYILLMIYLFAKR